MIKLRVSIWRDHPGFSEWALNAVMNGIRERQREISQTEQEKVMSGEREIGVMFTQAEECQQPPEAG